MTPSRVRSSAVPRGPRSTAPKNLSTEPGSSAATIVPAKLPSGWRSRREIWAVNLPENRPVAGLLMNASSVLASTWARKYSRSPK
jgi:hypothetical protein